MTRHIKRGGKIWIRVFPDVPVSKKPLEVRMGKGKGNVEYWVCKIQPGRVLYEMEGVNESIAREAFSPGRRQDSFQDNICFQDRNVMNAAELRGKSEQELRDELLALRT